MSIREFRKIKVTATARVDLPPVRIEAILKAWLANRAVRIRGDWDPGVLDADVQLTARAPWRRMGLTMSSLGLPPSKGGGATWCWWGRNASGRVDLRYSLGGLTPVPPRDSL